MEESEGEAYMNSEEKWKQDKNKEKHTEGNNEQVKGRDRR